MSKTTYRVILHVESRHQYDIEANSEEEALVVAEEMFEENDGGDAIEREVVAWDSYEKGEDEE